MISCPPDPFRPNNTQNGGEEYEPEYYLQKTLWWAMKFTGGTSSAMGSSHVLLDVEKLWCRGWC